MISSEEFLYFGGLGITLFALPFALFGATTVAAVVAFIAIGWSAAAFVSAIDE